MNLILKFLIALRLSHEVQTQKIVYDDQYDLCYAKEYDKFKTYPRPKTRCELLTDIEFERRFFIGYSYYCVVIDNRKALYHNVTFEFNEPTEFEGVAHDAVGYNRLVSFEGANKELKITDHPNSGDNCTRFERDKTIKQHACLTMATQYSFVILIANLNFTINRIISLKLDGQESCDPSLANVEDKFYANQINYNRHKYLNECEGNNLKRAIPESNYCEGLSEVNVIELLYNNQTKFWCISVNKPVTINKANEFYTVKIEVDTNNTFLRYINDFVDIVQHTDLVFEFKVRDKFIAAIEPREYFRESSNIVSIMVDGEESCVPVAQQKRCGEQKINHQPLVAFGQGTFAGKYPWHVGLHEIQEKQAKKYICGGSIIGPKIILTAAHCVVRLFGVLVPNQLVVHVGQYNLTNCENSMKIMCVAEIVVHDKFDFDYLENDIAILKLMKSLVFDNFVQPICLAENDQSFDFSVGVVAGWGFNEYNENQFVLNEAHMPIVNNSECRKSNREFFSRFLNDGKFCGGFRNGTIVCAGDSGGGLVFQFPNRWYIRGIVSLGISEKGFCNLNEYVLFTDVVKYVKWIKTFL